MRTVCTEYSTLLGTCVIKTVRFVRRSCFVATNRLENAAFATSVALTTTYVRD